MGMKGQAEIMEYTSRIVAGNHNNIMRRESIVMQANYDLTTVWGEALITINAIAADCADCLHKHGLG